MTSYSLVLLNGGMGVRVGGRRPKQLLKLRGIPILVYSLVVADRIPEIRQIVLNHPPQWRTEVEQVLEAYAFGTEIELVEGAPTRHASVREMLPLCRYEDVILHETARPLADDADFRRLIDAPERNAALMSPIPFTVAPVDPVAGLVTGSLERDRLRNVQLPQKFARADLADAHAGALARGEEWTEDATLVAHAGHPVHVLPGTDRNLKVTTPTDVRLAEFLLREEERDV
ncbi:IspD/TarI family cytidylyltransferase [Brachybacterium paraconglomeratum]|nr:2-C-methyl-D-erythritol 4-phosphate cytidylyltransferase [Brachybacterium paraconglomeratum]